MNPDDLQVVMVRDLRAVAREVSSYASDEDLWRALPGVTNCGGTLALHLVGNIRHFIGTVLGGSDFVRDRDAEFNRRDVPRAVVVGEVELAIADVTRVMPLLTAEALAAEFPAEVGGRRFITSRFLTHLVAHLGYHLGQMDYHRRMVGPGGTVGAMSVLEI
jgi:Protein of unknown function (DUF664)